MQNTFYTENTSITFYTEHILDRTHSTETISITFDTEHILYRTHHFRRSVTPLLLGPPPLSPSLSFLFYCPCTPVGIETLASLVPLFVFKGLFVFPFQMDTFVGEVRDICCLLVFLFFHSRRTFLWARWTPSWCWRWWMRYIYTRTHIHTHTRTHHTHHTHTTYIHTHTHTHIQTHKHTNTQTHKHIPFVMSSGAIQCTVPGWKVSLSPAYTLYTNIINLLYISL